MIGSAVHPQRYHVLATKYGNSKVFYHAPSINKTTQPRSQRLCCMMDDIQLEETPNLCALWTLLGYNYDVYKIIQKKRDIIIIHLTEWTILLTNETKLITFRDKQSSLRASKLYLKFSFQFYLKFFT